MALRLICGPARSGKTQAAVEAFGAALDGARRPVFIAPGQPDVRHFQRHILRDRGVLIDAEITTFNWFVENGANHPHDKRRASIVERRLVLSTAVRGVEKLEYLGRSASYDGFVDAFGRLVAEVQAAGASPQDFAEACRDLIPEGLNRDIFSLLLEYQDALEGQGLVDTETLYRDAVDALRENPAPLRDRTFIVHGFHDFTGLQLELLEIAAASARELVVTLPYVAGNPGYRTSARYHQAMSAWPAASLEYLPAPQPGKDAADLAHLRDSLFTGERKRDSDGTLHILEGAGVRGQAELVAAEILHLARHEQVELDDIVVVCRSLGADANALLSTFDEYGIPWDYGGREQLRDNPVGQAALAVLDYLAATDNSAPAPPGTASASESLLRYMRSAMPGYRKVDEFARAVRLHGVEQPARLRETWVALGGRPLGELAALEGAAGRGVAALAEEMEQLLTGITGRELVTVDADGTRRFGLGAGSGAEAALVALVSVIGIIREAARLTSESGEAGGAAARLLRDAIDPVLLDIPFGNRRGCVRVVDPHRVLGQQFDAVFICGLLEKQFPASQRVDPFIGEDARERLASERGIDLEKVDRDRWMDEERFLFLHTVARARDRLYLCYPYCDSQGSANVRSIFIDEAVSLFTDPGSLTRRKRISDVTFTPDRAPTPSAALHSLCLAAGNMHTGRRAIPKKIVRQVAKAAGPAAIGERLERCLAAVGQSDFRGGGFIAAQFAGSDSFSATALENYCACPFAYFIERVLRPAPMDIDTFFLDRGSIAHAALADFHATLHRPGVVLWRADAGQLAMAHEQMDRALDEAIAARNIGDGVDAQVMIVTLRHHLHKLIEKQSQVSSSFEPRSFEFGFGGLKPADTGSSDYSDITPLLGGWARLKGRIDRIDVLPETSRAVIVDYKSSPVPGWKKWIEECQLQIPLYIFAARQLGFEVQGGSYYALIGAKESGVFLDDVAEQLGKRSTGHNSVSREKFDQLVDEAEELALAAAEGIRAGDFRLAEDRDGCSGCVYRGVCRG